MKRSPEIMALPSFTGGFYHDPSMGRWYTFHSRFWYIFAFPSTDAPFSVRKGASKDFKCAYFGDTLKSCYQIKPFLDQTIELPKEEIVAAPNTIF
jgi:hypothetical protein